MSNITPNPSVVLVGSVNSSRKTLEKLVEHKIDVTGVLGLNPDAAKNVSGYVDLKFLAEENNIPFQYFTKINSEEAEDFIKGRKVDLLFIIGLSQMVLHPILKLPKFGCIGFHPTALPEGRGRGAVAWILLGLVQGAATLFHMDEGMDSGPIWTQQPFQTLENDYAQDVIQHIVVAIGIGLDKVLPDLKKGIFEVTIQDDSKASYLAKRNPEDGVINWQHSATEIHRLVRAVSKPLPGAYTYAGIQKFQIWKASLSEIDNHLGIPGRVIISNDEQGIHVQTGAGLLRLDDIEGIDREKLKVGYSLGLKVEKELLALLNRVQELENQIKNTDEQNG